MLDGSIVVGSRTPIKENPIWITNEVLTGGFVSGLTLAGGQIKQWELDLYAKLDITEPAEFNDAIIRKTLNNSYLTYENEHINFNILLNILESRK
jgi:hypothetical protein